tara:strand:- start:533 stop:1672 length:1140 start_codon:yes stop_codon:yes gene_type:complete
MSDRTKDPVALARMILEGKGKKVEVDEGLKKALKAALEDKQEEFDYEGKTYNVADFDDVDEAHEVIYDAEKDSGGETVPTPDLKKAKETGKKTKKNVPKPSEAGDDDVKDTEKLKGQPQKEEFGLDVDYAINEIEESDDMVALFNGEDGLSESFKNKARTIFEVAVRARVKDIAEALEAQARKRIAEITEANKEDLTESLDDYLSYVVEEWVKENQVALDRGIKSDIAESFMMGLKNLFEAHYIDMPDEKFDVVSNLENQVVELTGQINGEIQKNVQLNKELNTASCSETFAEVSEGLVDTQVEKLAKLAEGLEYGTVEQFREKLNLLKESYFGNSPRSMNVLNEEDTRLEGEDQAVYVTHEMNRYSKYMDREAKHNNY